MSWHWVLAQVGSDLLLTAMLINRIATWYFESPTMSYLKNSSLDDIADTSRTVELATRVGSDAFSGAVEAINFFDAGLVIARAKTLLTKKA